MRTILVLLIATGLGILFYHQKQHAPAPAETKSSAVVAKSAPQNTTQQASRPVSEHNWMKRSLDRATDVRDAARAQTQQSQDP